MIRKMTINDYDKVYNLWINTKGMGLNNIDDSRKGIDRYLKRNPDTCFIAEKEEKLVGVIICGHDGRRGYIYHLAVDAECRKQGIGRALVNRALEELKLQDISKVALVVFNDNILGNKFWSKLGFDLREDLSYRNKILIDMDRIDIE